LYRDRNIEICIDKSQKEIIWRKTAPNLRILRVVPFSHIKLIIYYRNHVIAQLLRYNLAFLLKNQRKFKVNLGDKGLMREYGIQISEITGNSVECKINYRAYIGYSLLTILFFIGSISSGNLLLFLLSFILLVFYINIFVDVKDQKEEQVYLNEHGKNK
jgi:hypothetical protein